MIVPSVTAGTPRPELRAIAEITRAVAASSIPKTATWT